MDWAMMGLDFLGRTVIAGATAIGISGEPEQCDVTSYTNVCTMAELEEAASAPGCSRETYIGPDGVQCVRVCCPSTTGGLECSAGCY